MSSSKWELVPAVSINGIEFGTERSVVKKILGKPKKVFRKSSDAANTTDAYANFHAYYTADDKLEAIEVFGSSISVCIDDQIVYPGTLSAAIKVLSDLVECYGSFISKAASVGISAEDDNIVSLLVGCKDYYR